MVFSSRSTSRLDWYRIYRSWKAKFLFGALNAPESRGTCTRRPRLPNYRDAAGMRQTVCRLFFCWCCCVYTRAAGQTQSKLSTAGPNLQLLYKINEDIVCSLSISISSTRYYVQNTYWSKINGEICSDTFDWAAYLFRSPPLGIICTKHVLKWSESVSYWISKSCQQQWVTSERLWAKRLVPSNGTTGRKNDERRIKWADSVLR